MANVRVCGYCGKVLEGPDEGKRVPHWPADPMHHLRDVPVTYKGQGISHGMCDPACREAKKARTAEGDSLKAMDTRPARKPATKYAREAKREARTIGPPAPRKPGVNKRGNPTEPLIRSQRASLKRKQARERDKS